VHEDWHAVFSSEQPIATATNSSELEKEKSLALSAYMLIRYYKTRGHELAELDPLSTPSPMQGWSTSKNSERFS
jgi:2-oxoglutarate dehydrogenase complex dehydrogenase (E1) component-like enzyme